MALDKDVDIPFNNKSTVFASASHSDLSSHHPPPNKRPRTGAGPSANISVATRERVISQSDSHCWLCGLHGRHLVHLIPRCEYCILFIPRPSPLILSRLTIPSVQTSAPPISSPSRVAAVSRTSSTCHCIYNEPIPVWTFLPTDLDPFIAAEQAYHDLRLASHPAPVPRPEPPQECLYTHYQIRSGLMPD